MPHGCRLHSPRLQGKLEFPRHFETHARDLVRKLLTADRTKRIGNLKNGEPPACIREELRLSPDATKAATSWNEAVT